MRKISIGKLVIAILIPLLVGGISAFLSSDAMSTYGTMNKPPLSPPSWVFPVAWTILYIMMGLASYFIWTKEVYGKGFAYLLYFVQLAMNFLWSIVFFNWGFYLIAFIWLIALWCVVILCACKFHEISKRAAYLLVPYILWLTFAAYLNMGAFILNM